MKEKEKTLIGDAWIENGKDVKIGEFPEKRGYMLRSKTDDWETPKDFYNKLNEEFNFNFDPCPFPKPNWGGLEIEWKERNFVNPPHKQIYDWVRKARQENCKGKLVVLLLPVRTDTKWFHEFIYQKGFEIRFIRGRLKFGNSKNSATFPSMVVIMR